MCGCLAPDNFMAVDKVTAPLGHISCKTESEKHSLNTVSSHYNGIWINTFS